MAENVGLFIALDDYYENITFLEEPLPGRPVAEPRYAAPLDLEQDPAQRSLNLDDNVSADERRYSNPVMT